MIVTSGREGGFLLILPNWLTVLDRFALQFKTAKAILPPWSRSSPAVFSKVKTCVRPTWRSVKMLPKLWAVSPSLLNYMA